MLHFDDCGTEDCPVCWKIHELCIHYGRLVDETLEYLTKAPAPLRREAPESRPLR